MPKGKAAFMRFRSENRPVLWASLMLLLATLAVYWPVLNCDFVNYDDNKYVTENPHVQSGLTLESLRWACTTSYAANWHPLTWLSHMVDCQRFGLKARGHHLTNLVFHLCNTLLLFGVLRRMTGAIWQSAMVAALFALHPAHVESVAWVAERKDVLSTFFFLLTLWAYARYAEVPGLKSDVWSVTGEECLGLGRKSEIRNEQPADRTHADQAASFPVARRPSLSSALYYLLALLFFALGLMSKPMLVTLPFLLLLLDYWPLRRFDLSTLNYQPSTLRRLLLEKLPFFALSALVSLVTMVVQGRGGSVVPLEVVTFDWRCLNALVSYLRYAGILLWPHNLAVIYPYSRGVPSWLAALAATFLVVFTLLALSFRRRAPYFPVGWFWFVGTLVPVIGLVQVGEQSMADRYTYIPSIGFFLLICWTIPQLLRSWPLRGPFLIIAAALVLSTCAVLTRRQLGYWRDSIALFEHAIAVTEDNSTAQATLGAALDARNRVDEAVRHYEIALQICPIHVLAHNNFGVALARLGRFDEAIAHYQAALETDPHNGEAHFNLANAFNPSYVDPRSGAGVGQSHRTDSEQAREHYRAGLRQNANRVEAHVNWGNLELAEGNYEQARAHYEDALQVEPRSWLAHFNLGNLLSTMGKTNEAIASFSQAVECRPGHPEAHIRLANLLAMQGQFKPAVPHFQIAVKLEPGNRLAWNNLGGALAKLGRLDEAARCLGELIRLDPNNPEPHSSLGKILVLQAKPEQAIAEYSEAVRLDPGNPKRHRQLALLLEQQGKREEAVRRFAVVAELEPQAPEAHYDLAVALVKIGKSEQAVAHLREAVRLRPDWVAALNNLAWLLATDARAELRNGAEAVKLAQRACELTGYKEARVLGTLDAAYAEAGQFKEAIETAQKTCELAQASGLKRVAETAQARLELYRAGKPYSKSLSR